MKGGILDFMLLLLERDDGEEEGPVDERAAGLGRGEVMIVDLEDGFLSVRWGEGEIFGGTT